MYLTSSRFLFFIIISRVGRTLQVWRQGTLQQPLRGMKGCCKVGQQKVFGHHFPTDGMEPVLERGDDAKVATTAAEAPEMVAPPPAWAVRASGSPATAVIGGWNKLGLRWFCGRAGRGTKKAGGGKAPPACRLS
jgi:hypothetical protein